MRWRDFAATLSPEDHRRAVLAVSAGLRETRLAAETVHDDGDLDELRRRLDLAIAWMTEARDLLGHEDLQSG
jgi:hypothetical protein